jgi:hypothetical protein
MAIDTGRAEERIRKMKKLTIWSKDYMLTKANEGNTLPCGAENPRALKVENQHDCKGIEYTFARVMNQISHSFYTAVPATYKPKKERTARYVRSTTIAERNALKSDLDPINGVVKQHHG